MNVRGFVKNHQESVLVGFALIFLAAVIAYVVWGIAVLSTSMNQAITVTKEESKASHFNLEGLRALKLPLVQ